MTEYEKMLAGELYNFSDAELVEKYKICHLGLTKLNSMAIESEGYREVVSEIIPDLPSSSAIAPPFFCDMGTRIRIGEHSFVNMNCTFLDTGGIEIGSHTKLGPNCQLYTPQQPINFEERRKPEETGYAIKIGNDCWLGGGVIVCPGVTIGDRCIIGAGSVVTRDIPDDSLAVGNPARVIRKLN